MCARTGRVTGKGLAANIKTLRRECLDHILIILQSDARTWHWTRMRRYSELSKDREPLLPPH
jgi:hypothetical protein